MPRTLSTVLVLALLAATAVAFVQTERLKLRPSPVTKVSVTKIFSPTCECDDDVAFIAFRLRESGRLTLTIVDSSRHPVRTLIGPVTQRRGRVTATWDGRNENGTVVTDGAYRLRVRLGDRTIYVPSRINVDTTPPVVKVRHVGPRVLVPGGQLKVRYAVNEPAQVIVFLNGRRALLGKSTRLTWKLEWSPRLRPGRYRLTLTARDVAGNVSDASPPVGIVAPLRIVTRHVRVRAGARFDVRLRSDGRAYRWRLAGRAGSRKARSFRLRAPKRPGRYRLVITQDGRAHAVAVVVMQRAQARRGG